MNARTILHLTTTEIRRSFWLLLCLVAMIIALPQVELFFLYAAVVTAHIALGDHWNRPTAHWRIRPVSNAEWAVSRLLLGVFFFGLPVAIQQGWVMRQTGFGSGLAWVASWEGIFWGLEFYVFPFVLATLAYRWKGVAANLLKALLLFYCSTLLFPGLIQGPLHSGASLLVLILISFGFLFGGAFIIYLSRRFENRWQKFSLLVAAILLFIITMGREAQMQEPSLPQRISFVPEPADREKGHRPVVRNRRAEGLKETEFITLSGVSSDDRSWSDNPRVSAPVWPLAQFNAGNRKHALFAAIPEDRVILGSGRMRKQSPTEKNLFDLGDDRAVYGSIHNCREFAILPFRNGVESLVGDWHFRLEKRGSSFDGREGRSFRLYISRANLLSVPSERYDDIRWEKYP
ncbi:MAG: hypothetical protein AAGC68_17950, partial [Verrucomicrobiota bacterium]